MFITQLSHSHTLIIFFIKIFFGQEEQKKSLNTQKEEKLRQNCIKKLNVIKKVKRFLVILKVEILFSEFIVKKKNTFRRAKRLGKKKTFRETERKTLS